MNKKMATRHNMSMNKKMTIKKNPIKRSNKTNKLSAKTNQNCNGKEAKKMKLAKTGKLLIDYDQDDYQAMFENCRRVMKGWTKDKLESYFEMNNEYMTMLEIDKKKIMDFEKSSGTEIEEAMKKLNETREEFGDEMTMKEKRDHRQMKMELIKHQKFTSKVIAKMNNKNKRNVWVTKKMQKMGETVKKAFNVVEIMLGMHVEE